MYAKWPATSTAFVVKFHVTNVLDDGLNFDITNPEINIPKPELKIPKAPDATFESAAVCLNWVSMYFGMKFQYPIRPNIKNASPPALYNRILFVKIRFTEFLNPETKYKRFHNDAFFLRIVLKHLVVVYRITPKCFIPLNNYFKIRKSI